MLGSIASTSGRACAGRIGARPPGAPAVAARAPAARRAAPRAPRRRASALVAAAAALKDAPLVPVMEKGEMSQYPDAPGVYAVYDPSGEVQYIGLSRKVRWKRGRTRGRCGGRRGAPHCAPCRRMAPAWRRRRAGRAAGRASGAAGTSTGAARAPPDGARAAHACGRAARAPVCPSRPWPPYPHPPQVNASVANHMQALPELTHSVRFEVIADGSRDALTAAWKAWMEQASEWRGRAARARGLAACSTWHWAVAFSLALAPDWLGRAPGGAHPAPSRRPSGRGPSPLTAADAPPTPPPTPSPRPVADTGAVPPGNAPGETKWQGRPVRAKTEIKLTAGKAINVPIEQLIDGVVKENKVGRVGVSERA
jgi:hypothetical protein